MAQVLKDQVKDKILHAGKHVFVTKGYNACTMREIAKSAQITVGNIYRYFPSKEAIYEAIVSQVIIAIDQVLRDSTDQKVSLFTQAQTVDLSITHTMAQRILKGLNEAFPLMFSSHRYELLILLQATKNGRITTEGFDLQGWIAHHLRVAYQLDHASNAMAHALISGIESLLKEDVSLEAKQVMLAEFLAFVTRG